MFREFKDSGKQRFSIKKYTFGVSSVLLGTFFAVSGNVAQAEENLPSSDVVAKVAVESPQVTSEPQNVGSIVDFDLLEEKAPAVAADSNTNPADLKYVLKKDDFPPATKVETKEVVATTEYVVDDTKDYGTKAVESVAKNGQVTTTTSYTAVREVPKEAKEINSHIKYSVDDSKELPSDKIVPVDEFFDYNSYSDEDLLNNFIYIGVKGEEIPSDVINYLSRGGDTLIDDIPIDNLSSNDEIKRYFTSHSLTDSRYAWIKESLKEFKAILADREAGLRREYDLRKAEEEKNINDLIAQGTAPSDLPPREYDWSFDEFKENILKNADTLTRNYNNSRGHVGIDIDHTKSGLYADERKKFEEKLKSLPVELFKNTNTLILTGEDLGLTAKGKVTGAHSKSIRREIVIRTDYLPGKFDPVKDKIMGRTITKLYSVNGKEYAKTEANPNSTKYNAAEAFKIFLHELGHNIDQMAGRISYANDDVFGTFSGTAEFKKIYKDHFEGKVVAPYYRDYVIEAFAESFSHYVLKVVDPTNYKKIGYIKRDVADKYTQADNEGILTVVDGKRDVYVLDSNGKETKEERTFDDAYYPYEKTFPYFDDLFAKLGLWSKLPIGFRYEEKVDVKETKAENGKILVGTKPKVENVVLPFNTITRQDPNLAAGLSQVLQAGKDGLKQVITKYVLNDKTTGEIETSVSENLLQAAIDEIILVGTKVVSTPTNVTPTTAKGTGVTQPVKPTLTIPVTPTPTNVTPTTAKGTGVTQPVKPTLPIPVTPTPTNITPTTAKGTGVTQPVKPTLNVTPVITKVVNTAKVTPKSSVQSNNVLPKTSASNEGSSSSLPAGLAATLIAAGLMTARKRNN